jgi:hypothetical protein
MFVKTHMLTKWSYGRPENAKEFVEKYVHIPMPWTRLTYHLPTDDLRMCHPVLGIYWHNPAIGNQWALSIRIGWTTRDATSKGMPNVTKLFRPGLRSVK